MSLRTRPRFIATVVAVAVMIFPIPNVLIGEWPVRVTDQNGDSVSGIRVSQSWENYTYGLFGGEDLYTDSQGRVVFPRRRQFAPSAYWLTKATLNIVGFGVHAGFGSFGRVWISDPKLREQMPRDPKAIDRLASNCSNAQCTDHQLQSHLQLPSL